MNSFHYRGEFRGQPHKGDSKNYAQQVIDKAIEQGIQVLAITDHNSVQGIDDFREAASGKKIHIFPGFELSSREGIHILCVYPLEKSLEELGLFLGELGIRNPEQDNQVSSKTFSEILKIVPDQGGITIAAHVTHEKGLFKALTGQPRVNAWKDINLLAIQIPGPIEDLPVEYRKIIENKNTDYHRPNSIDSNTLPVAVLNAKDVADTNDLENCRVFSWIKMSKISIKGLRQAFLDPGSRVRLNPRHENLEFDKHPEISYLEWKGGLLNDIKIHLNTNLNVLIGGRGTGKSTLIESIRAVLELESGAELTQEAHEGIIKNVLCNGTKITMGVRIYNPTLKEYIFERTLPNHSLVLDHQGEITNFAPTDIFPVVEIFGQNEISELTRSNLKLTRLLERFSSKDERLSERKEFLKNELRKNRHDLCETLSESMRTEDRLASLPLLEERLNHFEEAGLEGKLKMQSIFVREEHWLDSVVEQLQSRKEILNAINHELPTDKHLFDHHTQGHFSNEDILNKAINILAQLNENIENVLAQLIVAFQLAEENVDVIRSTWNERKQQFQKTYESILRELQKSSIDGEEFIQIKKNIEKLRPLQAKHKYLKVLINEFTVERETLLTEWENVKDQEFQILKKASKKVNRKLHNRVKVEVLPNSSREPLYQLLRNHIKGRFSESIEKLESETSLSLSHFVSTCRSGSKKLSEVFGIPIRQAELISNLSEEVLMRIEEVEFLPTTNLSLNTSLKQDLTHWRKLEDLSTGQKATAVLLLLLIDSDIPLIVDQPEDDLDNRFITGEIIPKVRQEKQKRQFIFSTHNANIPVLGDAEMIIGLSADVENDKLRTLIFPEHVGSIDSDSIRDLVEDILEGGRDAFENRRRKYGF
ncbi:MAG: PHP domain-containing protein [Bacteroidetes bacterium]|nr:PHP domain-containing protein [Bacteroidota bacterium]